jgi:hypothetical protein
MYQVDAQAIRSDIGFHRSFRTKAEAEAMKKNLKPYQYYRLDITDKAGNITTYIANRERWMKQK